MNATEKKVISACVVLIIILCVFPPWRVDSIYYPRGVEYTEGSTTSKIRFRFIFSDPEWRIGGEYSPSDNSRFSLEVFHGQLRFDILAVEIFVVALVGAGCVFYLKS